MSKVVGIPAKNVERRMLSRADLQSKIWAAVPMQPGENLKAYFPRAAGELGWTPRRVRAWWNGEARRIDHIEVVVLETLKGRAQENEQRLRDLQDDIAKLRAGAPRD